MNVRGADGKKMVSAFFIDTEQRQDKSDYNNPGNRMRKAAKTVVLGLVLAGLGYFLWVWQEEEVVGWGPPAGCTFPMDQECSAAFTGTAIAGFPARRVLVFLYAAVFTWRVMVQMLYFWHRKVSWVEVIFEAGGVIPLSLASFAVGAVTPLSDITPLTALDAAGGLIFFVGTYVNLWPEYTRHVWKLDSKNKGKLYTQGLWKYARRINYTGEILSFVGYAMASGPDWWVLNLWVPAVMAVAMGGASVAEIEHYLAFRYKAQWTAYVKAVPYKMIPGVW